MTGSPWVTSARSKSISSSGASRGTATRRNHARRSSVGSRCIQKRRPPSTPTIRSPNASARRSGSSSGRLLRPGERVPAQAGVRVERRVVRQPLLDVRMAADDAAVAAHDLGRVAHVVGQRDRDDDVAVDQVAELLGRGAGRHDRPAALMGEVGADRRAELARPRATRGGARSSARARRRAASRCSLTSSSTPSSSPTRQTSRRSSSTSTHAPAEAGKTTWSPRLDRHRDVRALPPVQARARPRARSRAAAAARASPRERAGRTGGSGPARAP